MICWWVLPLHPLLVFAQKSLIVLVLSLKRAIDNQLAYRSRHVLQVDDPKAFALDLSVLGLALLSRDKMLADPLRVRELRHNNMDDVCGLGLAFGVTSPRVDTNA